jgi:phosphoadenosine phosphosulfate reductase family protein
MSTTSLVVALSGGIDSTALALRCPEATLVFTDTGWEFPELYAHLDRLEHVTGRSIVRLTGPHLEGLPGYIREHAYFPGPTTRYCTRLFKIEPLNRWLSSRVPCTLAIGLRADEPARAGNLTKLPGLTIRYPLREQGMRRVDCVHTCLEHDLLPRYPPYMLRGGCQGCFFKRPSEVQALIALDPSIADDLQALEEEVQDVRGTYYGMFSSLRMPLRVLRDQPLLFPPEDVYTSAPLDDGSPCGLFCHR